MPVSATGGSVVMLGLDSETACGRATAWVGAPEEAAWEKSLFTEISRTRSGKSIAAEGTARAKTLRRVEEWKKELRECSEAEVPCRALTVGGVVGGAPGAALGGPLTAAPVGGPGYTGSSGGAGLPAGWATSTRHASVLPRAPSHLDSDKSLPFNPAFVSASRGPRSPAGKMK